MDLLEQLKSQLGEVLAAETAGAKVRSRPHTTLTRCSRASLG